MSAYGKATANDFADIVAATGGMQLAFNDKIEVRGETVTKTAFK